MFERQPACRVKPALALPLHSTAAAIARRLHRRGILTKLRHSAAQQVEGGCGQLRARSLAAGTAA